MMLMQMLEQEIRRTLDELGVQLLSRRDFPELVGACTPLRDHCLKEEQELELQAGLVVDVRARLSESSFWDITPKYRIDLYPMEIVSIANQLAFSIALASIFLSFVACPVAPYDPTIADALFWQNVSSGLRFASSGWDRLAILLDVAYGVGLREKCNLRSVLRSLLNVDAQLATDPDFKQLKTFRDGRFKELESHRGGGARHEATHTLSPAIRYFAEIIESDLDRSTREFQIAENKKPIARRNLLVEHHAMYVSGIRTTANLVARKWPSLQGRE